MSQIMMWIIAAIAIITVIYMLVKKQDIKITLFAVGLFLMYIAVYTGGNIVIKDFEGTGILFFDPIMAIIEQFKSTLQSAGFIILILGGYTAYMSHIGANQATVRLLLKPLKNIKSSYLLVPLVFLLGHVMSLVIPSASNLAIILLATLFPVMKAAGLSTLSIAGVIATTATIMPTPLGGDNVAVVQELQNHSQFIDLSVSEYVFSYHAKVSIPTILIMAIIHYLWQRRCDNKINYIENKEGSIELQEFDSQPFESKLKEFIYSMLPVLPILILLAVFIINISLGTDISLSVEVVVVLSFIVAILCELFTNNDKKNVLSGTENFFKGMGDSIGVVVLLVAASTFVMGLRSIGVIDALQNAMTTIQGSNMGWVLPLVLVAITCVIVLISGSGTALFYSMVPLMVPLADAAGISPFAVTIPMGLAGNLMRAVSPVSAVVMIVAGTLDLEPIDVVKRTSVPMIVGLIVMFILSMVFYL